MTHAALVFLGPVSDRDRARGERMAAEAAQRQQVRRRLWGGGYANTRRPPDKRWNKRDPDSATSKDR